MTLPRFFAPDAREGVVTVVLPPDEANHLIHVLRLRPGADVRVFNGDGSEWRATVGMVAREAVELGLGEPMAPAAEPAVRVTLGIGVLKGDQMDAVVRDATALGVSAIAPFSSAHVTVPMRARPAGAAVDRWRRVAIASAKQCGRAVVPQVASVARLEDVIGAAGPELKLMAVEPARAERSRLDATIPKPSSALVLVGPEGGWAPDEIAAAVARGARLVHVGPRTLRAQIAPTVLLSSLWTLWGW